jgi:hypothetical protein
MRWRAVAMSGFRAPAKRKALDRSIGWTTWPANNGMPWIWAAEPAGVAGEPGAASGSGGRGIAADEAGALGRLAELAANGFVGCAGAGVDDWRSSCGGAAVVPIATSSRNAAARPARPRYSQTGDDNPGPS